MVRSMDEEHTHGLMIVNMKVTGRMIKYKDMAYLHGLMVVNTKATF
jgi:hypothetical protein